MRLAILAFVLLGGCRMSRLETARTHDAETRQCVANELAIIGSCHTQAECRPLIEAERARCDAARAYICRHGKGCP